MTEQTKKPVPLKLLAIEWAEDSCFEPPIVLRPETASPPVVLPPALTPNDTGFLAAPPSPM